MGRYQYFSFQLLRMVVYKNGKGNDFRIYPANCAMSNQYKSWHLNEHILAIAQDTPPKQKKNTPSTYYVITDEVRGRGYRWIKWTLNMSSYMPASEYNQDYDKYCVSARIDVHFPIPFTHNQHAGNRQVFYEDQNRISTLSSWPWPRSRCQFKP